LRIERLGEGVRARIAEGEEPTVICFPCAGNTSTSFLPLIRELDRAHRIVAVDPPGHGIQQDAAPIDRVEALVETYVRVLHGELSRRPFLLGHSLGGLIAYLVALRMEAAHHPPAGVMICAAHPPRHVMWERWSSLSDDDLIFRLEGIGGIPDSLRNDRETVLAHLESTRADFRALERWYIGRSIPSIAAPLAVVAGRDDRFTTTERVREWLSQSTRSHFLAVDGGHFVVQERAGEVAQNLIRHIASALPTSRSP
jgi:external thioesterase TEII